MGDENRLMAGGLCGKGDNAYEQTWSVFTLAETLLHEAGMEFTDVVRTWIYLREMERDYYPGLNKARREFFDSRGIDPVPASTGIEGGMVSSKHDICMGFYAVKSGKALMRTVMTTPTLNEAGEYGADFTRGMQMTEANKVALHVSGTASIDEQGRTAHLNDIGAQIDRMILNISTLLKNQGASFSDIAYAYNYLKDPADEQLLKDKFKEAGLEGFPSIFVHAEVCRPDLLCETEVLAILPKPNTKPNHLRATQSLH
jgi:enamine deaminase RidA (YjgF/YER057c/UK114 family)